MSEETPPVRDSTAGVSPARASPARCTNSSTAPLGCKPLDLPARLASHIEQPVMQPVGAALPELDRARQQAVAAPLRRPGRVVAVTLAGLVHRLLEHLTRG